MKQFRGFPAKMQFSPLPKLFSKLFFSQLLPQISDIVELKTTLYFLQAIYHKRGYPRFVTYKELLNNAGLMSSINKAAKIPDTALRKALATAVKRGTILHLVLETDGVPEDIYFLNTESDRQAVAKIQNGELALKGLKAGGRGDIETEELPDIFTLYEENMGMLTPMIAEELLAAEKLYPKSWIRDAIKEAVNHNKRKWSYVSAILEHWSAEGKSNGTHRRDSKTGPEKYFKGRYGHMVRH